MIGRPYDRISREVPTIGSLASLLERHPHWVLAAVLLLTLLFGWGIKDLHIATDVKDFFAQGHPELEAFNRVAERFGGIGSIVVALEAPDVFEPSALRSLDRVTARLAEVAGVRSARGLTTIEELRARDGFLEVGPLVGRLPTTPGEAEALAARIESDPLYAGNFVSTDRRAALILVQPEPDADAAEVANRIALALEPERRLLPEGMTLHLAGMPVLNRAMNDAILRDLRYLIPIILVLIGLILWIGLGSRAGVLLPLSTVLLSVVWTFGLMGHLGIPVSQLGAVIPVLLISVGSAYGIHMMARYHEESDILGAGAAARGRVLGNVLRNVGAAVLLAALTTMVGFASNAFTPIVRIIEFGLTTAFGVGVALLLSVTWVPALQAWIPGAGARPRTRATLWMASLLTRTGAQARRHRGLVLVTTLAVVLVCLAGLGRVRTESDFISFLPRGNPTREAFEFISREFGGADALEVMVEGDIQDPGMLRRIEDFKQDLSRHPAIHSPMAVTDLLARAQRVMNFDDPRWERVPDTRAGVAQYLLLLSLDGPELLEPMITLDASAARIQARVQALDSQTRREALAAVQQAVDRHFGNAPAPEAGALQVTVTGTPVLLETLEAMIVRSQVQSLAAAFVAILAVMLFLTRSFVHALLTTVPVGLAVLVNFGTLGWTGIPLDIVTALVASIAIGIGIDYSIHVYSRYREARLRGRGVDEALREAVDGPGLALTVNAAAVVAGFLVLLASAFRPLQYLGVLAGLTMVASLFAAITVVPALLHLVDSRRAAARPQAPTVSGSGGT